MKKYGKVEYMTREEYEDKKRDLAEELETAFEDLSTSACASVDGNNNVEDIISKAESDLYLCMFHIELIKNTIREFNELQRETIEEEEADE